MSDVVKIYITVGPPGSGKSTWAKENIGNKFECLFSSDSYREKLLGDERNQSNNRLVFDTLYKDLISAVKDGKSVCFDATNIDRKDRSRILALTKNIKCEKIAVVFNTDINTAKERNRNRKRFVPENVIDRMFSRFEYPCENEGFDSIITI